MRGLLLKDDKEKEKDGVPTGILLQDGKDGKTGKKIIQNVCVNCGQVMGSEDSLYQVHRSSVLPRSSTQLSPTTTRSCSTKVTRTILAAVCEGWYGKPLKFGDYTIHLFQTCKPRDDAGA